MTIDSPGGVLLEPMLVGDIMGDFFVPAYQRGYRWGAPEVGRLLDDVVGSRGEPYYLQPVVIKARPDEKWELVDGQQRLTTLYLILKYMQDQGLQSAGPTFSLEYETRPDSRAYLEDPDETRSQENIDFFHISEAYRCIHEWFEGHGHRRQHVANEFYGYLFETVRVIWYEAPPELDSTTLFTRLNIGRIPLTDAELVKALLLTRATGSPGQTQRSHEIAAQWDSIEKDLRAPEIWAFATGKADGVPTHISLLLDTLADRRSGELADRERPLFHTFETLRPLIEHSFQDVWNEVVDLHSLVLGWHDNRNLFHKIGYLIAHGHSLRELDELSKGKAKSSFEAALDERIRSDLKLTAADVRDLSYKSTKSARVLLLMNVETIRRMEHSTERYSFRAHASDSWSLEHIHAQNAERLNRAEQWTEWLRLHKSALEGFPGLATTTRTELSDRIDKALAEISEDNFRPLERELTELFTLSSDSEGGGDADSIANLALLASGDNSALSNSVFEVKRREILRRDQEGSYIPVCTRNAFLKYYTEADAQQIHFWGAQDRETYLAALLDVIGHYLLPDEETP